MEVWKRIPGRSQLINRLYLHHECILCQPELGSTGSWIDHHSMASLFTRVTYDYSGKYLLQLICVVMDLPALPRITNGVISVCVRRMEVFRRKLPGFFKPAMDDGKIRVSYGVTGNESIGNYDYVYSMNQAWFTMVLVELDRPGLEKII